MSDNISQRQNLEDTEFSSDNQNPKFEDVLASWCQITEVLNANKHLMTVSEYDAFKKLCNCLEI